MLKKFKSVVIYSLLVAMALIAPLSPNRASAQNSNRSTAAGTQSKRSAEGNPKLKEGKRVNVKGETGAGNAQITRRGADTRIAREEAPGKTRGLGPYRCGVHIINESGWTVDVYIDGAYRGTVSSYGDLYIYTGNGATRVYGESVGGEVHFGPSAIECIAGYWNPFRFIE
ncbi:MAG: hypothetical protein M3362_12490 [Acidobacteriota bacterium]|nr:hypothetical protein [Acidobacteriota bacterium]